jgi:hypothetical protein
MASMNGVASILWQVIKWSTRGLLALIALAAILWSGALFVGSMRLTKALEAAKSDPRFSNPAPANWDPAGPGENGGPYFAAAFALHRYPGPEVSRSLQTVLKEGWASLTDSQETAIRGWLESKKSAFDLVAEGARRPWCRYIRSWTANPWEIHAPEVGGVIFLGRSLIARAAMQSADGDRMGARESIRLAFAVADSLRDEPPSESLGFRLGLHEPIQTSLLHIIPKDLTAQECDEWRALIPGSESYDGILERALRWDSHVLVDLLSGPLDRFWHAWKERKAGLSWRGGFQRRLADPFVKLDGVRALEEVRRLHDVLGKPYQKARMELQQMWSEWHDRSRGRNPVRTVFVIPSCWYLDRVQVNRSLATLLRTGLEWEKARLESGKYPERCEIIDPCTAAPFVMESSPPRITALVPRGLLAQDRHSWTLRQ